ncbi:putative membrane metal-binding protein [Erythrobacter dokdonensis DSW-74]|uniref:Putative membrane metal-binding protein n=2 Tax=Erythrobacter TaxID=1041 RepID=A0A1A7BMZ6_9SPHN|nr:putative membrane metal-binding protein [Erythrobacter dokdonensis DSW-74]
MRDVPIIPMGDGPGSTPAGSVVSARPWQSGGRLSSTGGGWTARAAEMAERFLAGAGFDRAPWLAVLFMAGILAWFAFPGPWYWVAAIAAGIGMAGAAMLLWPSGTAICDRRLHLRNAMIAGGLVFAAGLAVIWVRSGIVGAEPIAAPQVALLEGYVLEREDQPAEQRIRLTLAIRDAQSSEARKVRINVPLSALPTDATIAEGAVVRSRARLMPPASPMLPGSYNFARAAWFKGLAATGSALGPVELVRAAPSRTGLATVQRTLSAHVRERVDGSAGTIAAAFASGDRGGIARADEEAMRDAGLTHLLSISGLHVSAVIAAAYFTVLKLLALWPALALRVRLPVVAAAGGALAGIGYTLLTGAEVPTVRSCVAAMLVLIALALGRDALSMRMVAVAAGFVLLLWPESAIGPSFQMSFSAVLAIIAVSGSGPVRAFLAAREEPWWARAGRRVVMLFVTGLVIELALMPVVLFHFHRAGLYGALANVVAIPLVTFVSMPLIAIALVLDLAGAGAPVWWLVEHSLDLLLGIAHLTAAQPGAVKLMPQIGGMAIGLFAAGGLWLALWSGRARLLGLVPAAVASVLAIMTPIPDLLVSGDGRQVGITIDDASGERQLLSLRDSRSDYARDNLIELAGVKGEPVPLAQWPGARCSSAFCVLVVERGGRDWAILMARTRDRVEERALASACERADIVIADRYLPRSCRPRWLKADRRMLDRSGGLSINLASQTVASVAQREGQHGWWKGAAAP